MSRRHRAEKREVLPDPKFGDVVLSRFMNVLMYDGKKSAAEGIVYAAMDTLKRKGGANADPLRLFHEALDNVKPAVEVRSRRVGGATYQVPVEVRPERRQALAIVVHPIRKGFVSACSQARQFVSAAARVSAPITSDSG